MQILGLDEVGRGAWAGPLVVGAVLGDSRQLSFCRDSKSLSSAQRERLCREVQKVSIYIGLGWSAAAEIDRLGIELASIEAARRAISSLSHRPGEIIIDGRSNWLADMAGSRNLIRADATVSQVSAASIIAKVFRDRWMRTMAMVYDRWWFEENKGYGTEKHRRGLEKSGGCAIHRYSYEPLLGYAEA